MTASGAGATSGGAATDSGRCRHRTSPPAHDVVRRRPVADQVPEARLAGQQVELRDALDDPTRLVQDLEAALVALPGPWAVELDAVVLEALAGGPGAAMSRRATNLPARSNDLVLGDDLREPELVEQPQQADLGDAARLDPLGSRPRAVRPQLRRGPRRPPPTRSAAAWTDAADASLRQSATSSDLAERCVRRARRRSRPGCG